MTRTPAALAIESLGERKFVHRVRLGGPVSNIAVNWQAAQPGYATPAGYTTPPAPYGQPGVPQYYGQSQALPPGMPATQVSMILNGPEPADDAELMATVAALDTLVSQLTRETRRTGR